MKAVLFALNAKYIHSSLAPWCLLAGVEAAGPAGVCAEVREGTVNEPERDVLARILDGEPDAVLFSCYLWNIRETLRLAAAVKAARPGAYVVLGGPEVSYNAGEVLAENPQVDYILSGEGERSVPMLLAFILLGMLCGSDGLLKIEFSDYTAAERVCSIALIFIMFYGGRRRGRSPPSLFCFLRWGWPRPAA